MTFSFTLISLFKLCTKLKLVKNHGTSTKKTMASKTLPFFLLSIFLLFLSLPASVFSSTYTQDNCTVKLGTSLFTNDSPPWLSSPEHEFALGFHPDISNSNSFILSIWFNHIETEKTIVWFSKSDNNSVDMAPLGSQVILTSEGEFLLRGPDKNQIMKANTNGSKAKCGALLDNGNFLLLDDNYNSIWESFRNPSDTILPCQTLNMSDNLIARNSMTDYSSGRFQLALQPDGNLVLYNRAFQAPVFHVGAYWATNTVNVISRLIFSEDGNISLSVNSKDLINLATPDPGSKSQYYYLARLDYDGVFKEYKYPRMKDPTNNSSLNWMVVKSIPDNICLVSPVGIGSGSCGFNSYCRLENGLRKCYCPSNYSYNDPHYPERGCKPDFPAPGCHSNGWESNDTLVDFIEVNHTNWPTSDYDLQTESAQSGMDKEKCKDLCRKDCFCAAAIYRGNNCWKKKFPLSNGRFDESDSTIALLKIRLGSESPGDSEKNKVSTLVIVGAVFLGSSVFLNFLLFLVILGAVYLSYHKKLLTSLSVNPSLSSSNVRSCTYKELEDATGGFKRILGEGAFGTVYEGVLATGNVKRFVAIKKLDKLVQEGEKEFQTEVHVIGQTHHKNLVRLLGFCDEGENRLLVYDYMSNGSLANFLFRNSRPDWNQRVQISFGIARGLTYLHEECSTQIIHCDIKPQNILLDGYFTPRISDFGLAKLLLAEQTRAARTVIRGTVGYFAPEWFRKASITVKVDVYSFGVVLLEIVCCKSSTAFSMGSEEDESLVDWVYDCYKEKKLEMLVKNDEEAKNDMKMLERVVMVAIWCIQEDASLRPSMKKVAQMLEGVIEVSIPPRPFAY